MKGEAHTDCIWVRGYQKSPEPAVHPCPICAGIVGGYASRQVPVIWVNDRWCCAGCNGTGEFAFYHARVIAGEIKPNGAPKDPNWSHDYSDLKGSA